MSTEPNPTPPAPAPSSAAPGTSSPASADFKFGDDAPAWARGKSAHEILNIATTQNAALERLASSAPVPAPAPAPANPSYNRDDYVTGHDLERFAGETLRNSVNPDLQRTFDMIAENNLDAVKREFPDYFRQYGPEITANLALLTDKRAHTLDNLRKVVKITLVDHVDAIADERASRRIAEMEPTLRSGGGGGSGPISQLHAEYTLKSEKLPADWSERAAKVGLTEAAVDEFCRANDMTREAFFKQFESTAITEGTRR